MSRRIIYLDNNATTMMSDKTIEEWCKWANHGNPSAAYLSAKHSRKKINEFKLFIAKICNFKLDEGEVPSTDKKAYRVIFTSCATESNNTIIKSVVDAYNARNLVPHVILSAIEHKSSILCAQHLEEIGSIQLSMVPPDKYGFIHAKDIAPLIRENTCLISIMHANNELGTINEIAEIGKLAHDNGIPFHTDVAQTFGKFPVRPLENNVDAFSISFHKIYGPPSVGALVIKSEFMTGYKLCACIAGSQNFGFRGGTENTPGIAASHLALDTTLSSRTDKNGHLTQLKKYFIEELNSRMPCRTYKEYLTYPPTNALEIVILSPASKLYLANTVFLSVVKHTTTGKQVCNGTMKKQLEEEKFIVSVGSACNTDSKLASHVLSAIGADDKIKRGALRISFSDSTKIESVTAFIKTFANIVNEFNN
jgi:cysteine desulfurase